MRIASSTCCCNGSPDRQEFMELAISALRKLQDAIIIQQGALEYDSLSRALNEVGLNGLIDGRCQPPPQVVATPTYLLDGKVISLGNPRPDWLVRVIADNQGQGGPS